MSSGIPEPSGQGGKPAETGLDVLVDDRVEVRDRATGGRLDV